MWKLEHVHLVEIVVLIATQIGMSRVHQEDQHEGQPELCGLVECLLVT